MPSITLGGKTVNDDSPCYVIAEIGHNHGGDLQTCIKMVKVAANAGCDCVKLQKRTNHELYTRDMYSSPYTGRNSYGKTYGEHREALEFGKTEYLVIKSLCRELGIDFAATAFDVTAAKFLSRIGIDWIKIASGDLTNMPLLEEVSKYGTPIIFSTGGATGMTPILEAYNVLRQHGSSVAILQCTSGYPAQWDELNLRCIAEFREAFPETVIGWSMHARGISLATAAYALGARIIEAHFTLDRYAKGTDQYMSLEPDGMGTMVNYLGYCHEGLGDGIKKRYPSEVEALLKQWKNADGKIDGLGGTEANWKAV